MMKKLILLLLLSIVACMPPGESHEDAGDHKFVKDHDGTESVITVKKVFVSLKVGPYTFKKRTEKGGRVTFTCNGCGVEGK